MAGGRGVRLKPLTDTCPKPMLPINGEPMLKMILLDCIEAGFVDFHFSVNYMKDVIKNYFGDGSDFGVKISYLEEQEHHPLGTAGSLGFLNNSENLPILVMNGDVRTQIKLNNVIATHLSNKADITICAHEHFIDIPFGVIESVNGLYTGMKEKPTYKYLVNAGIYVLDGSIVQRIIPGQRIDMPELIEDAYGSNSKVSVCPLKSYWIDVGRPEDYKRVQADYGRLN